jgi:hypothetical protein
MDMPFPVTGGIIVNASPTEHSAAFSARAGRKLRPDTAQNDSLMNWAPSSRWCRTEPPRFLAEGRAPCLDRARGDELRVQAERAQDVADRAFRLVDGAAFDGEDDVPFGLATDLDDFGPIDHAIAAGAAHRVCR